MSSVSKTGEGGRGMAPARTVAPTATKPVINAREAIRLAAARWNAMLLLHGGRPIPNITGYQLRVSTYEGERDTIPELIMTLALECPQGSPGKTWMHIDVFAPDYLGQLLPADVVGIQTNIVNYDIDWLQHVVRAFKSSGEDPLEKAINETLARDQGKKWLLIIHSSQSNEGGEYGPVGIYLADKDGSVCVKLGEVQNYAWVLP